jgi:alpha-tubulin suppressor-like RCC1 family protein
MPVNQSKKETDVQASLDSVLSTATNVNIVSNSWMANVEVDTQEFVNYLIQLPTYNANNWPVGQIVFVNEILAPVVAGNSEWLGIDGRSISGATTFENKLYTWGRNLFGALGDGTVTHRCSPGTTAGGGVNWCQIAANEFSSVMAIKTDGTLWTWGVNGAGQLGNNTVVNISSPGTTAGGGTTWCRLGCYMGAAIKTDGTLWTWGCNFHGDLGDGTTTFRSSPGTTAGGGTNWSQISTSLAIKTDGTLWSWGFGTGGRLGNNLNIARCSPGTTAGGGTNWCQVSSGGVSSAIKTDGTLWTWGCNAYAQLGDGTTVNRSSPGTIFGGGESWCLVSTGSTHVSAIKVDGSLWTWGSNGSGQLGSGTTVNRSSPGTVAGSGTTWCQVGSARRHTLATKTDGTLWTWGRNSYGKLGDGTSISRSSPGTVIGSANSVWCFASGNYRSSFGINIDNTIC